MKKTICLILTVLTAFCFLTAASAAGYTLPEKMERQLQVGSGLKGSFVIHSNADQELSPFVHSIRNAAYEIRGIRSGDDLHYYIYQPGEGETLSSLTEFCRIGNTGYLRSDFLPEAAYRLPDFEEFIASFLKAEGENPSILPELIRLLVKGRTRKRKRAAWIPPPLKSRSSCGFPLSPRRPPWRAPKTPRPA